MLMAFSNAAYMLGVASAARHSFLHVSASSLLQSALLELPLGDGAIWLSHAFASAHDVDHLYTRMLEIAYISAASFEGRLFHRLASAAHGCQSHLPAPSGSRFQLEPT